MTDLRKLSDPFPNDQLRWKPQVVIEGKAMMVAYVDARDVAERFDEVLGSDHWQVDHKEVGGQVFTGIGVQLDDGTWGWKWDIGFVPSRGDDNISIKGAASDGLKRAAVLYGVARYLYRVPGCWCRAETLPDGRKWKLKRLLEQPSLPPWAMPGGTGRPLGAGPRVQGTTPSTAGGAGVRASGLSDPGPKPAAQNGSSSPDSWTQKFWEKVYSYDMERRQGQEFVERAEGDLEAAYNLLVAAMEPPEPQAADDEEIPF